jgi:hypothetical protein
MKTFQYVCQPPTKTEDLNYISPLRNIHFPGHFFPHWIQLEL